MQLPPAASAVPATRVAFLFPGQGSQALGMLASCKDLPPVRAMLATAQRVLGYDLLAVCTDGACRGCAARARCGAPTDAAAGRTGPKSKLDDTVYAQPALFVAGLAAVEKLRAENPGAADSASACAGLSLGEYTALVFAGALSFEDGLKVVKTRAESMAAAAAVGAHGMLSVVGLGDAELDKLCAAAAAKAGPGCVAACAMCRCTAAVCACAEPCDSPTCFILAAPCAAWPTICSRRAAWCPATRWRWRRRVRRAQLACRSRRHAR